MQALVLFLLSLFLLLLLHMTLAAMIRAQIAIIRNRLPLMAS